MEDAVAEQGAPGSAVHLPHDPLGSCGDAFGAARRASAATTGPLHGPDTAETFLAAYEEAAGMAVADVALWDLFALSNSYRSVETWLPDYHDLGRGDLSAADVRERQADGPRRALT